MSRIIALLTDFGTDDIYVGVMKGAIKRICPDAELVDLTHAIQPQNVLQAAFALMNSVAYFPPETVFLAVVDPGVGSQRKAIAVSAGGYYFVAPDNGLLTYALAILQDPGQRGVELANPEYQLTDTSHTFHGRDIFAPAAAYIACNPAVLQHFGDTIQEITELAKPELSLQNHRVQGTVVNIDHFGNIISDIGKFYWDSDEADLRFSPLFQPRNAGLSVNPENCIVQLPQSEIQVIRQAYHEVAVGEWLAQIDSNGFLEVAVNQGNAAERTGVMIGDEVILQCGETTSAQID